MNDEISRKWITTILVIVPGVLITIAILLNVVYEMAFWAAIPAIASMMGSMSGKGKKETPQDRMAKAAQIMSRGLRYQVIQTVEGAVR